MPIPGFCDAPEKSVYVSLSWPCGCLNFCLQFNWNENESSEGTPSLMYTLEHLGQLSDARFRSTDPLSPHKSYNSEYMNKPAPHPCPPGGQGGCGPPLSFNFNFVRKALQGQTLISATVCSFDSLAITQRAATNFAEDRRDDIDSEKEGGVYTKRSAPLADVDVFLVEAEVFFFTARFNDSFNLATAEG